MNLLYLCGAGNSEGVRLALNIDQSQRRWERIALLDDDASKHGRSLLGVEIIGPFEMLGQAGSDSAEVANLVARTTARRRSARLKIQAYGRPFATLVHPSVDLLGTELGKDVIAYQNVTIGPEASIDEGCVLFMGAVVGHECRLGQCCVMGANAVLNARVELGDDVYVGTNATVLPEIEIGASATIGAGSVVIQDVPAGATAMGVPAQILMTRDRGPDLEARALGSGPGTPAGDPDATEALDPELEQSITDVWKDVLQLPRIGVQDRFFAVGGDSLLAMRVCERVQRIIRQDLPLTEVFRFPTVRSLANHICQQDHGRSFARRGEMRRKMTTRRRRRIVG